MEKARAAVTRALELDPDLAEAHTALGLVRFYFEWDWAGADAEFRRAFELNPGSHAVNEEYGWFLTAIGPLDEGLARSREAASSTRSRRPRPRHRRSTPWSGAT